jgi:hypothetical protein
MRIYVTGKRGRIYRYLYFVVFVGNGAKTLSSIVECECHYSNNTDP